MTACGSACAEPVLHSSEALSLHVTELVDVVFPRAKLAVFVDGCFWHYCDLHASLPKSNTQLWMTKLLANRRRDAAASERLRRDGWEVLRFWEHDDPSAAADTIEAALGRWRRITRRSPNAPALLRSESSSR